MLIKVNVLKILFKNYKVNEKINEKLKTLNLKSRDVYILIKQNLNLVQKSYKFYMDTQ